MKTCYRLIRLITIAGIIGCGLIAAPALAAPPSRDAKKIEPPPPVEPTDHDAGRPDTDKPQRDPATPIKDQPDTPTPAEDDGQATESGDEHRSQYVGWIELSGSLREGPPAYAWAAPDRNGQSMRALLEQIKSVADDDDYVGLVIYLNDPRLTLAQIDEVARAIHSVRDAGRTVLAFSEAYTLPTYLLACAADRIALQNKGQVELAGLGIEEMYLAGLLEKLGMEADLLQVGRFKGADESLTRTEPTEQWDQNIDALLDNLYDQVISRIVAGRGLTRTQAEDTVAESWTLSDQQCAKRGLIDDLTDRDMTSVTSLHFGEDFLWHDLLADNNGTAAMDSPFAIFQMLFKEPGVHITRPTLAVIHANGPIVRGETTSDPFGGEVVASGSLVRTLADAQDNELIKGVVLRVDSPGGSALASELIWQAAKRLSESKPLYVSIGSTAASGGYYLACAGHRVYTPPTAVLGSIGVVGGKIILGGLYEKIGVNVHRRSRGRLADMFNSVEPFTPEQRAALLTAFNRTYEQFTERITSSRGDRIPDIDTVAHGRLFTGEQAVQNGLADRIGGLQSALNDLADEVGLSAGEYDIVDLPPPMGLAEALQDMFGVSASNPLVSAARQALGPARWQAARPILSGLLLLRQEPLLTLMPAAILIH